MLKETLRQQRVFFVAVTFVFAMIVTVLIALRGMEPRQFEAGLPENSVTVDAPRPEAPQSEPPRTDVAGPARTDADDPAPTDAPQSDAPQTDTPLAGAVQPDEFPIDREPTSVTMMAVGDNLMHITVVDSGLQDDGTYDYTYMYQGMLDDIQGVDIACINQETPFVEDPSKYSNYPCFGGPTAIGDSLAEVGFDLVTHATNHVWDKGETGFHDTLNLWKTHPEVTVLGVHETREDAEQVHTIEKNGITIALLNYTYGMNGFVATEDWMVDLLVDKDKIARDIEKAKDCSDIVIVFAHWGTEYKFKPTAEQEEWAQFFADHGVGAVIGGHPHVLEPVETVTGADGNEMVCFYSLGNYISAQSYDYQMLGGMANLTITKDNNGTYVSDYELIPTMTVAEYGGKYKLYSVVKLEDYSEQMASKHVIANTSPSHMWELYHDIVDEEET